MTNLEHLSDEELIHHLDIHSTDPVVRRLVKIFNDNNDMIYKQLLQVGMSRDGLFESSYEYMSVGEYIEHLRSEVAYYQNEAEELEYKLDDEKEKSKRLSARGIAEVIEELHQEIKRVDQRARDSEQACVRAEEDRKLAREQLKAWNHLRTP
jgi:hypothetical protein